jgi:hypothetical protein
MKRPLGSIVAPTTASAYEAGQVALDLRVRQPAARERLRLALADGRWHQASQLERIAGRRFGARIHELRRGEGREGERWPPMPIARRRSKSNPGDYEYRALAAGEISEGAAERGD